MKIVIVKQTRKWGERYYAYREGILSRLGIFCVLNKISYSGGNTPEECLKFAKFELEPNSPVNSTVVKTVEV